MYRCESWTVKKVGCRRTDAFKLWCWIRPLRVTWTTRRSNQSILKDIYPEYLLEGLMLKLKFQFFGHLMQRPDPLEKTLILGKIEGKRKGWQRMRCLDDIIDSMDVNLSKLWEVWHAAVHWVTKSQTQLIHWTTRTVTKCKILQASLIQGSPCLWNPKCRSFRGSLKSNIWEVAITAGSIVYYHNKIPPSKLSLPPLPSFFCGNCQMFLSKTGQHHPGDV